MPVTYFLYLHTNQSTAYVTFVNVCQFVCVFLSFLVLRVGFGI